MKRLLIALGLACLPLRAEAAVALVAGQLVTGGDNVDVNVVFSAAPSGCVITFVSVSGSDIGISLTGTPNAATTAHGPNTHGIFRVRAFLHQGDGSDNSYTIDLASAGVNIRYMAVEVSGSDCTEAGTSSSENSVGTSHSLDTDISLTAGDMIIGMLTSDSGSDFSATGSTTAIPSTGTDFNDSLGGYQVAGSDGAYDLTFSSTASEDTAFWAIGVNASGGGGGGGSTPCVVGGGIICGGAQ